jgi:hypothetical protein
MNIYSGTERELERFKISHRVWKQKCFFCGQGRGSLLLRVGLLYHSSCPTSEGKSRHIGLLHFTH